MSPAPTLLRTSERPVYDEVEPAPTALTDRGPREPPMHPELTDRNGLDDAQLVASMARGDRAALAALYDRYASTMLAVAVRMLGERRESEDLLHDVFLEAWRQSADFDPQRGSVRAWLMIRVRSRALDRRKSAGATRVRSLDSEPIEPATNASDDPSLGPDRARVSAALARLPDEQRTVLELGYFEGLSSSEIAERIGAPIGTVKSRVAAALGKLRAMLADQPGDAR